MKMTFKVFSLFCWPNKTEAALEFKVKEKEKLQEAIEIAFAHDDEILIESFMNGKEVTCGIHNFEDELTTFPATEIISENDFFDFEAKYEGKVKK